MQNGFLPISRKDMEEAGIKQLDFVYVCGDAYVDHPSFGHAIISRILQAHGYTCLLYTSSDVLKRMGRKTNKDDLVRIIHHLRKEIPDITLRTTLICGFPGETEEQHKELLEFVQEMKFDRLGAFTYSPEEGTKAAEMENQIPEEKKKLWQQEVMELQEEIIFEKNEDMVDRELYAFIEGKVADENAYVGRTYRDAPSIDGYIFVNTEETLMTGDFAKVKVTGAYEYDLIGELV